MDKYLVIILAFWLINQFVWRLETWRPRAHMRRRPDWIEQCITSPPTQYRPIGYMGDGFYRSKDPTNSIKVLKKRDGDQNIARPETKQWSVSRPLQYANHSDCLCGASSRLHAENTITDLHYGVGGLIAD